MRTITPSSFLLIFFLAKPTEDIFLILLKVFVVSLIPGLIFVYLGYVHTSQTGKSNFQIPYLNIFTVAVISIPLGLLYNQFSITFIVEVYYSSAPLALFTTTFIFIVLAGLINWGNEFGSKIYYSQNKITPTQRKKKLKRKKRDLYPNSIVAPENYSLSKEKKDSQKADNDQI